MYHGDLLYRSAKFLVPCLNSKFFGFWGVCEAELRVVSLIFAKLRNMMQQRASYYGEVSKRS